MKVFIVTVIDLRNSSLVGLLVPILCDENLYSREFEGRAGGSKETNGLRYFEGDVVMPLKAPTVRDHC